MQEPWTFMNNSLLVDWLWDHLSSVALQLLCSWGGFGLLGARFMSIDRRSNRLPISSGGFCINISGPPSLSKELSRIWGFLCCLLAALRIWTSFLAVKRPNWYLFSSPAVALAVQPLTAQAMAAKRLAPEGFFTEFSQTQMFSWVQWSSTKLFFTPYQYG